MTGNDKLLWYHVREFLREKNLLSTLRSLERESGVYLDVSHVQHLIRNGDWVQLHNYLTGFFSYGDDTTTMEISFQIKKQKFFEALKRGDQGEAVGILYEEGNIFGHVYQKPLSDLLLLAIAEDPWIHELSAGYNDEITSDSQFGSHGQVPSSNPSNNDLSRGRLCSWIKNTLQSHSGLMEKMKFLNIKDSMLSVVGKHHHALVQARDSPGSDLLSAIYPIQELPKETLTVISLPFGFTCFEFHPNHDDMLVVGTRQGSVVAKKIGSNYWKWYKLFGLLNSLHLYSQEFTNVLSKREFNPVTCLKWSPDGLYLGVGFSVHLLQVMSFSVDGGFSVKIEILAHNGSVNDVAFFTRNETLFIVTCGSDGLVKIWNLSDIQNPVVTFEGHSTSVTSVSFCQIEEAGLVFSTDCFGKMKIWQIYDPEESDFDAQGCLFSKVFSKWGDEESLFTLEEGDSLPFITEWGLGDTGLTCKHKYVGLEKTPLEQLSYDNNGKILIVGNKSCLKFWDTSFGQCLWTLRMELEDTPVVRMSKNGLFLAVSVSEQRVMVFGNMEGLKLAFFHASAPGEPIMPRLRSTGQYEFSARALGVENLKDTMATFVVPSLSVNRASVVELRGHPQMLNAKAPPYVSTAGASNPGTLASQVDDMRRIVRIRKV